MWHGGRGTRRTALLHRGSYPGTHTRYPLHVKVAVQFSPAIGKHYIRFGRDLQYLSSRVPRVGLYYSNQAKTFMLHWQHDRSSFSEIHIKLYYSKVIDIMWGWENPSFTWRSKQRNSCYNNNANLLFCSIRTLCCRMVMSASQTSLCPVMEVPCKNKSALKKNIMTM